MLLGGLAVGIPAAARGPAPTIAGQVTDILSSEPVRRAKLRVQGHGSVRTDEGGRYSLALVDAGTRKMLLRKSGFYTRRTYVSVGRQPVELDVGLIPTRGGFDLEFFDHVFRSRGRRGTEPWSDPTMDVEIWTRIFELDSSVARYVDQGDAPASFVEFAQSVVADHIEPLTGGHVRVGMVRVVTHPAGTQLTFDATRPAGVVRIAVASDPARTEFSLVAVSCAGGPGSCWGAIDIHPKDMDRRAIVLHELGHVLGWDHPLGRNRVPLPSLMGPEPEPDYPTEHDLLHGPILYSRPVGSRTPDRDPRPPSR